MKWLGKLPSRGLIWRLVAAAVMVGALASVQAASAASPTWATITVFAPGATLGTPVQVEWLDHAGIWRSVDGWTGTLDRQTGSGVPFKTWTVFPGNYGEGPFRWVIGATMNNSVAAGNSATVSGTNGNSAANNNMMATTAWGMSSPFLLPNSDGVDLPITVQAAAMLNPVGTTTGNGTTTAANANTTGNATNGTNANSNATTTILPLSCPTTCDASVITAQFTGLPKTSWITIEWLDGNGFWQPVLGWQGMADSVSASGMLTKQFGVYQQNYGQGPFRWAVYSQPTGGSLLAVSPNFNLPTANGQEELINLAG